jgi:hypothetical protein
MKELGFLQSKLGPRSLVSRTRQASLVLGFARSIDLSHGCLRVRRDILFSEARYFSERNEAEDRRKIR